MIHNAYKSAFLEIMRRYNMVYKDTMNAEDIYNVQRLISSGIGFWESGEKGRKYYLFPCTPPITK